MVVYLYRYLFQFLILIVVLEILAIFQLPDGKLHLVACDVGQGDAILATFRNFQILTDGGPANGKVMDCLSKHIPFWDREIEVVVNSHPQLDHYGGLIEVFKRYRVDNFVGNALESSSNEYQVLKREVGSGGTRVVNPMTGVIIRYNLISYDIFWPSHHFLEDNSTGEMLGGLGKFTSDRDPNEFSLQAILSLGNFHALLTGDIGHNLANEVLPNLPAQPLNYIKIPHHGSKNGMTSDYLSILKPEIAVISVGKNNTYGHPAPEILKILSDKDIKVLRTDQTGDLEIVTDGDKVWWKNQ